MIEVANMPTNRKAHVEIDMSEIDAGFESLTVEEIHFVYDVVICGMSQVDSYKKNIETQGRVHQGVVNALFNDPRLKLYKQWLLYRFRETMTINTEMMLKDLTFAWHISPEDFIDAKGKLKHWAKIDKRVKRACSIKEITFDEKGQPKAGYKLIMPQKKDILDMMHKIGEFDPELVKTLVAELESPEINLKRN